MPRLRHLAPLTVWTLACACSGAGDTTTTGFMSGPGTSGGPGPSSFGTTEAGASSSDATVDPTTGTPTSTSTGPELTSSSTTAVDPTSGGSTDALTGSSSGSTGDASTATGDPACGNGVVEGDEACDDGNMIDGDACRGDCTAGTAVLALIGVGTEPAISALFTPDIGWTSEPAPMGVAKADLETTPGGAMAVIRRASAKPDEQNELFYARWSAEDPALFDTFTKVGAFGFAKDGPSIASVADTVTLAFLGTDNKHYTALYSNDAWAVFTPLPAGMVMMQAFGPSAAGLAPGLMSDTYAFYTGDDARIYYSSKASPGGAWAASQATPPASVLGTPVGVVDDQADLILAYVRKTDGKLALIKLITPMNAWSKEVIVHPDAITGSAIAFVRADAGGYGLAWRGFDNQGIYLATAETFDVWAAPLTVEVPMPTTSAPALVPGAPGAELEVLYTAGGKLRHARVVDGQVVAPVDVPGIADASNLAATRVQLAPN